LRRSWKSKACISCLCFLLVMLTMTVSPPGRASAEDGSAPLALVNGGFEQTAEDGRIPGWTQIMGAGQNGSITVSDEQASEGINSLKMDDNDGVNFAVESDKLLVQPGTVYTAKASVYIGVAVQLQLRFYNNEGALLTPIPVHDPNFQAAPASIWADISVTATAPEEAAEVSVVLASAKGGKGTTYWDHIQLASELPVQPDPGQLLANGGFEESVAGEDVIPGWTITSGGSLASVRGDKAQNGANSLHIENTADSGVRVDSARVDVIPGGEYLLSTYTNIESGYMSGIYVYVYDENGAIVQNADAKDFTTYIISDKNLVKNTWHYLEQTFTVPPNGKQALISIITNKSASTSFKYNLDELSLTPLPDETVKIDSGEPEQVVGETDVTPFQNVIWTAKTLRQSGTGGKADLRFYNVSGQLLSIVSANIDGGFGEWTDTRIAASAPKDASLVRAVLNFPSGTTGVYYANEMNLAAEETPEVAYITDLGPQSQTTTVMTGAYGKDKNGNDVMFTVVQGDPGKFAIVDVNSGDVLGEYPLVALDGSPVTAAWAIAVATDGKVYVGSTPNGTLFQYNPETEAMRTLGKPVSGDTVIWTLEPGKDGKIYGGTGYSQSIFEYDPADDEMKTLTSFKQGSTDRHVRSLAYDSKHDVLYAGLADIAKLYRYDIVTGEAAEVPIPGSAGKTSVYDLEFAGGKLFVRVDSGPQMFVYEPAADEWVVQGNSQYNARGFSPLSPDNRVFYTVPTVNEQGLTEIKLVEYDIETDIFSPIDVNVKGVAVSYGYVELDDPDFPGVSLVGLAGNSGMHFYYNLDTGRVKTMMLPLPPQFAEIHNIGKSLDGKILTAGFISGGGLGIYSPSKNETELMPSMGQIEGYTSLNGKMYFGVYPGATLFEYDPRQEWNRTDSSRPNNPLRLFQLGFDQDRPISMIGVEETGKLYIGTFPKAGKVGGALSIFDPATRKIEVKQNIVQDHSINTMLHKDGKLFIGTGAMDGTSGKLVIYDIATDTIEFETVPVSGKKALSSFIWGPDGQIWGMALGALFIFDPETRTVVYSDDKFPIADYSQNNARLQLGTDNHVYGSLFTGYVADKTYTSKLFKIDSATKQMDILLESNVEMLLQDDFGNFYFKYGSSLMKYSDPALTVKMIDAVLELPSASMNAGDRAETKLTALLEKGRSTVELSGAAITYTSSNSGVAQVDDNGVVTAIAPGSAELSASVTLQGVTVTTNKVQLTIADSSSGSPGGYVPPIIGESKVELSIELPGNLEDLKITLTRVKGTAGLVQEKLKLSGELAEVIAKRLNENSASRTVVVHLPDTNDETVETVLEIDAKAAAVLAAAGIDLVFSNDRVSIAVAADSLGGRNEAVTIQISQSLTEEEQAKVVSNANDNVVIAVVAGREKLNAIGQPIVIHTNLQSKPITLTLPIDTDAWGETADNEQAGVYIEHSDGTQELVRGEIVELDDKGKLGIRLTVDRFSTFVPMRVAGWESDAAGLAVPYIQGYADGSFRPERSVTRAEVAAMIARILGAESSSAEAAFKDVQVSNWSHPYVAKLEELGLMQGYADGSFKPERVMTRAEMATVLQSLLPGGSAGNAETALSDMNGHWASEAVERLQTSGVVQGYDDGTFRPDRPLSRAEAVVMINAVLKVKDAENADSHWTDVSAGHWAFGAIHAVADLR